ncbi:hypothetical protein SLA_2311 [Streptomyces laurentii]|uniref:Uncharacterized protein n=1 Tax=Streptomyces laurentii TaxID=39478 RepID=A0A160NWW8_STRLU|nr:hypothetical protein SLA_2311 [Streptomyces laurentii]
MTDVAAPEGAAEGSEPEVPAGSAGSAGSCMWGARALGAVLRFMGTPQSLRSAPPDAKGTSGYDFPVTSITWRDVWILGFV